jgi:hypothetical protein
VFVGLRAVRHWIHGTRFTLEVDCVSLKQMIHMQSLPSAAETRWCWYIKLHDFQLVHVLAEHHKVADGLSRRPWVEEDTDSDTDPEDWLDARCEAGSVGPDGSAVESGGASQTAALQTPQPPPLFNEALYKQGSTWWHVGMFLDKREWGGDLSKC